MDKTIGDIMTRRSVRNFEKRPVSRADLETIVEAALSAPSASGQRPWHVVVIEDEQVIAVTIEGIGIAAAQERARVGSRLHLAVEDAVAQCLSGTNFTGRAGKPHLKSPHAAERHNLTGRTG